jgi:hypothetical protein
MIKTRTIETVEEFNDDGKLIKKTTTETTEENDAKENWYPTGNPNWWTYPNPYQPTVTYTGGTVDVPLTVTTVCSGKTDK